jgi:hypothetical protein
MLFGSSLVSILTEAWSSSFDLTFEICSVSMVVASISFVLVSLLTKGELSFVVEMTKSSTDCRLREYVEQLDEIESEFRTLRESLVIFSGEELSMGSNFVVLFSVVVLTVIVVAFDEDDTDDSFSKFWS